MVTEDKTDYSDGYDCMVDVCRSKGSSGVIAYANDAGPKLDSLYNDCEFAGGMRDALRICVDEALLRIPSLECSWKEPCDVPVQQS